MFSRIPSIAVAFLIVLSASVALLLYEHRGRGVCRCLVIHSDDAGFCAAQNAATIQAMENGCSATISLAL